MAFNSNSYHRNKRRRESLAALAAARSIDDIERKRSLVRLARIYWQSYLGYRRLCIMNDDSKRIQRGEMTAAAFVEKWKLT